MFPDYMNRLKLLPMPLTLPKMLQLLLVIKVLQLQVLQAKQVLQSQVRIGADKASLLRQGANLKRTREDNYLFEIKYFELHKMLKAMHLGCYL